MMPMYVCFGTASKKDGVDAFPEDVYDYYKKTNTVPTTAAIPPGDYADVFAQYANQGYAIIHIAISSAISSCFQNSKIAAAEFEDVYPVDSKSLSTGSGLVVLEAARLIEEGFSAKEAAEKLTEFIEKVDASFVVDSLEFLKKGGRCSALAEFGANLFKLKPCIELVDGKMIPGKKYRGAIQSVIGTYIEERLAGKDVVDDIVFMTHSKSDPALVEAAREKLLSLGVFKVIEETDAGCTITAHCGENTLGILFKLK